MADALAKLDLAAQLEQAPRLAEFCIDSLRKGYTPLAVAKRLQQDLMEFTSAHPMDLQDAIKELYRRRVPLEERLADLANVTAIDKSVAKQLQVTTPIAVLEKLLYLQLQRIEIEHGLEIERDEEGTIILRGKAKEPGRISSIAAQEIETARRLAKDLHTLHKEAGRKHIDGSGESGDRKNSEVDPKLKAQLGRLARHLLDNPEVIDADFTPVSDVANDDAPGDDGQGPPEAPAHQGAPAPRS